MKNLNKQLVKLVNNYWGVVVISEKQIKNVFKTESKIYYLIKLNNAPVQYQICSFNLGLEKIEAEEDGVDLDITHTNFSGEEWSELEAQSEFVDFCRKI